MKKSVCILLGLFLILPVVMLAGCKNNGNGDTVSVESVTISGANIVTVNQEITYTAIVIPDNATNKTVEWSIISGGTANATISSAGLFKATTAGTVTIKASAEGKSDERTITVNTGSPIAVDSVEISGQSTIVINIPQQYNATVLPENATIKAITWAVVSGNASITSTGLLTATSNSPNTVTISATADGVADTKTISVSAENIPVESVSISGADRVFVGVSEQYTAVFTPTNATHKTVTWEVVSGSAIIAETGLLTATGTGIITISVSWSVGSGANATLKEIVAQMPEPLPQLTPTNIVYRTFGEVEFSIAVNEESYIKDVRIRLTGSAVQNPSDEFYSISEYHVNFTIFPVFTPYYDYGLKNGTLSISFKLIGDGLNFTDSDIVSIDGNQPWIVTLPTIDTQQIEWDIETKTIGFLPADSDHIQKYVIEITGAGVGKPSDFSPPYRITIDTTVGAGGKIWFDLRIIPEINFTNGWIRIRIISTDGTETQDNYNDGRAFHDVEISI